MLTVDQAQQRWCPLARVIPATLSLEMQAKPTAAGIAAHNRIDEGRIEKDATWNAAMRCVGVHCMAWRWSPKTELASKPTSAAGHVVDAIENVVGIRLRRNNLTTNKVKGGRRSFSYVAYAHEDYRADWCAQVDKLGTEAVERAIIDQFVRLGVQSVEVYVGRASRRQSSHGISVVLPEGLIINRPTVEAEKGYCGAFGRPE